ncbi:MAG: hypothetical protein Barrevirus18_14 [Barrevirus sp.]|uniref:Uncharacterized protein n=1 Tax=Barrevirus sp. TaxID=2487763 RepID=A0A3G4ZQL8_9VIRU|nr:MAG: hypothetical protein Barrevirus18_14 [Barrevirus sp.]
MECPICYDQILNSESKVDSHMQKCYYVNNHCSICYQTECDKKCEAIMSLAQDLYSSDRLERENIKELCRIPFTEYNSELMNGLQQFLEGSEKLKCEHCYEYYEHKNGKESKCQICKIIFTHCDNHKIGCTDFSNSCSYEYKSLCKTCYKDHIHNYHEW